METVNLAISEAYALARDVLSKNGFSAEHADAIARNVTAGERDGCASHGLWRLLGIVETLRKGKVSADARPVIIDQAPAIVKADAGGAFSLVAYEQALPLLISKAKACGIAALAINRCVHFSALFADIEPLTDAGLVGYACTPSHAWVAPAGARVRCLVPTRLPSAGRVKVSRPIFLIWRPARRRGVRSSYIIVQEKPFLRAGGLTRRQTFYRSAGGAKRRDADLWRP